MPAASKAAIRHSQKLLGRTSAIGAFMIRLLHICFRRRPCGFLALLSRTFWLQFLAALLVSSRSCPHLETHPGGLDTSRGPECPRSAARTAAKISDRTANGRRHSWATTIPGQEKAWQACPAKHTVCCTTRSDRNQ